MALYVIIYIAIHLKANEYAHNAHIYIYIQMFQWEYTLLKYAKVLKYAEILHNYRLLFWYIWASYITQTIKYNISSHYAMKHNL